MKTFFVMDEKDYDAGMEEFEKWTVRAVIERDGRIATQCGFAGDYKLLGGGIDAGESPKEALAREIREEAGLFLIPDSMEEVGLVEEIRRDCFEPEKIFHCYSMIYRCQVTDEVTSPQMTESEIAKGYHLVWATPEEIVSASADFLDHKWICRDAEIIRKLYYKA